MTRAYGVTDDGLLDLIVDGEVVATLPFDAHGQAIAFGSEFVDRDPERQAAMLRHPAGRRLAE